MYLISVKGYKNARIDMLIIKKKKTGEIGVRNISDLILEETTDGIYKTKNLLKGKLKIQKIQND